MSNKVKRPDGYNEKTSAQINQEYNDILFKLGQAVAMEKASIRQQVEFEDDLEQLEGQFKYSQRFEARQAQEAAEKAAKEAAANTPPQVPQAPTTPTDTPTPA